MKTRFLIITAIVTLSIIILSSNVMTIEAYHNDKTSRGSSEPEIATFGTNAYVVWEESMDPQFSDVYFRKIVDNSSSFDEAINLTLGTSFYPDPSILASKNNVYVLWEDRIDPDGKESVYFKKSNDDGKTFDNTITLDPTTNDSIYRPITMLESNGILYVFVSHWNPQTQRNNLSFITSDDNGNAFSDPVILFESEQWEQSAHIIVKDDVIYAVADDANNYDEAGDLNFRKIYSDKSTSKILKVNSEGSSVTTPQVSVSGDNVYVVWREFEQKRWHLSFAKSNDGGNTFDKPITLNTDPNSIDTVWSTGSHIFAHNDSVYVIWPEEYWDGENQTFKTWYAKSDDAGNTFDVALHPLNEKRSKYGDIITLEDSGILYFVVPTFKNPPYNDPALYFAKNSDNGNTLTKAIDLLENTVPAFGLPKIAIKENSIQIVSGGDYNKNCILYLTSSDGGMSFTSPVNLSPNGNSKDCLGIQEFVPSPLQQLKMGINSEDVKCKEVRDKGYLLGLRQRNNFPVCVTVNSYEDLLSRGFLASDSFETLALMAAEKFVISSPTFSFDGIPNSLDLDIDTVRKSIPPVVTINGEFESRHPGYGYRGDVPNEKTIQRITIEVAQTNKIHSAIIDDTWDEIAQKPIDWDKLKENLIEIHSGPTSSMILTVGNKTTRGLIPVSVTEISENVSDEITFWQFQPIGYNGDNRGKSWDFLPKDLQVGWGFFDENGKNPWDNSRIPQDMFGIPADLHGYTVYCGEERIDGESGHPSTIPIKLGTNTVYAKSGSKGILPDSDGIYTIKFVSLFKTTTELPDNAEIITNDTKLCVLEQTIEDATHAYYTKLVFKFGN